ncbi:hypothetical protein JBE04_05565 [Streptomyces sp. PRKS01-29]|nr:hypothetical protein [Streptomyces sabulosicollis]
MSGRAGEDRAVDPDRFEGPGLGLHPRTRASATGARPITGRRPATAWAAPPPGTAQRGLPGQHRPLLPAGPGHGEGRGIPRHRLDARHFESLAGRIKNACNAHFLNEAGDRYGSGRQVTSVLPLAFGPVPADKVADVGDQLARTIVEHDGGHLDTGIFGTRYLVDALARTGRIDLAMAMLHQRTYPRFGFQLANGATTTWEQWLYRSSMETHDHAMFAGINTSFSTVLAGIRPTEPGYRDIAVEPPIPGSPRPGVRRAGDGAWPRRQQLEEGRGHLAADRHHPGQQPRGGTGTSDWA